MKRFISSTILFAFVVFTAFPTEKKDSSNTRSTIIRMYYGDKYINIELEDNEFAREFVNKLPLTVYANNTPDYKDMSFEADLGSDTTLAVSDFTNHGDLFYYPNIKQMRFVYDFFLHRCNRVIIGRQIGKKRLFSTTSDGAEVTFKLKD